jgi:uncharacterized protein YndB with AHSA1/START domain
MKKAANEDYSFYSNVCASSNTIFLALTDVEFIRQWWENPVTGSAQEGGELKFSFNSSDDDLLVYVDIVNPHNIQWTIIQGSVHKGEWAGTTLAFDIEPVTDMTATFHFSHIGLHPRLHSYHHCVQEWERLLPKLVTMCESLEKLSNVSR